MEENKLLDTDNTSIMFLSEQLRILKEQGNKTEIDSLKSRIKYGKSCL